MAKIDLTGKQIGHFYIEEDSGKRDNKGHVLWRCLCVCGRRSLRASKNLINDNIQSCCGLPKKPPKDLTSQTFGILTAIRKDRTQNYNAGHPYWYCQCECGNSISIPAHRLYLDLISDCGCQNKVPMITIMGRLLDDAISRCYNTEFTNFHLYGAYGTKVYSDWIHTAMKKKLNERFDANIPDDGKKITASEAKKAFHKCLGDRPTPSHRIELIDSNGHFYPGNIRWATPKEIQNNRRNNRRITIDDVTKTATQWRDIKGVDVPQRLANGWDEYTAVTAPEGYTYIGAKIKYEELSI